MVLYKSRFNHSIKKITLIMYYLCPSCSSNRKPKLINYFPPVTAKCLECGYMNLENKFIKEEEHNFNQQLNYSH